MLILFPFNSNRFNFSSGIVSFEYELGYSPRNSLLDEIVRRAALDLSLTYSSYEDAQELNDQFYPRRLFAGVEFDDNLVVSNSY